MSEVIRRAGRRALLGATLSALMVLVSIGLADPSSPISVTNVDSPDPVASGAQLQYTITVVNTAGSKLTNLALSDQVNGLGGIGVPPRLVLTSTRGTCSQNVNNLVTCNGGSLEGGGSWTVTIRGIVTAANATTLNNTASITGTRSAQNFTTTTTATTLVTNNGGTTLADLTIAKTGPTTVNVGSPMSYVLTVNNQGTANATNVKVVDTLPPGVNFVSTNPTSLFTCTPAVPTPSPVTVVCVGGAVNQGSNATITVNGTSPAAPTTITNTASVDPDNAIQESNELNNTSALVNTSVITGPPPPTYGFSIDKTDVDSGPLSWDNGAGPDPVRPGENVTYKILVTNISPSGTTNRADDVVVVDGTQGLEAASIQVNQVITNGVVGNGNGCVVTAPQVRCSIRSLDPGGTMLVTITGQVVGSAGSSIFNTATVTGNIKNMGRSATDSETTTVRPGVDLTITKTGSPNPVCARSWPANLAANSPPAAPVPVPPTPPLLGPAVCLGGLTYEFVVGNSGLDLASGVVLRDPLPPGTVFHRFDDLDGAGFTCGPPDGSNVLQCTGGAITAATTKRVRIVLIAPPTTGTITNTVTVDPANAIFEGDETNNTATYATDVVTGIDLAIAKYDTVDTTPDVPPLVLEGFDPIATNGTQTYTIEIDNLGPQDVTGIRIQDTLPAGTVFRSAQEIGPSHGFTCSQAAGIVDCQGGALKGTANEFYFSPPPGNDRAVIKIKVFAQGIIGTMHNEVRVDPFNQIPEINELNNIAAQDTEVSTGGAGAGAFNELTIDKKQTDPDKLHTARNAVVTYTIEIKNDGTDPVTNIVVRDFLPAGARYIEATGDPASQFNCSQQGGHIECVGGKLPAAAGTPPVPVGSAIITVKMFAPDTPGTYTNQAIVDPDHVIPEGNEFNNQDSEQTVVENGGDGDFNNLKIHKTSAPEPPASTPPGGPITYTLQVWNEGEAPALNVSVRDELPAGVTFVSAFDAGSGGGAAFTCNYAAGVVNCIGATILENTAILTGRSITINVKAPNQIATLENEAIVDPDNTIPEGDELDNTAFAQTIVQSVINLKITKTGPPTSSQSQQEKYTIKVKNEKPTDPMATGQTAFGVQMHDPLPVGVIPLATEIDPGDQNNWACQIAQNPINVVDCQGDLNPDQEVTIVIDVFMTAESGKSLDNEACVDPLDLIKEYFPPGETDNCSTHTTAIVPLTPNLSLTKTSNPASVTPGADLTYTLLIHNIGTAAAPTPITITDTLPTEVNFVGASGTNGWTCTFASPNVTCSDPGTGLGVGEAQTMTIQVTVDSGVTLPFTNKAEVPAAPGELDGHKDDNKASVTTQVGGSGIDLIVTSITDSPDPVAPSQVLTYTVIAVNAGTDDVDDADIRIDLPTGGVVFQSADGTNGFNCTQPGIQTFFTCTGDLPHGGDTTITVKLTVMATLIPPTDLTLSATIDPVSGGDPDGEFTESNEGNNTKSETTTVSGVACVSCVDLVATEMVATPGYTGLGVTTQTFTAQVVNVGDQSTGLDSTSDTLLVFDVVAETGTLAPGTLTLSDPAYAPLCTTTSMIANVWIRISCRGNLGPAQGLTLTYDVSAVTGDLFAQVIADPDNKIKATSTPPEFREDNNLLYTTVFHF